MDTTNFKMAFWKEKNYEIPDSLHKNVHDTYFYWMHMNFLKFFFQSDARLLHDRLYKLLKIYQVRFSIEFKNEDLLDEIIAIENVSY